MVPHFGIGTETQAGAMFAGKTTALLRRVRVEADNADPTLEMMQIRHWKYRSGGNDGVWHVLVGQDQPVNHVLVAEDPSPATTDEFKMSNEGLAAALEWGTTQPPAKKLRLT